MARTKGAKADKLFADALRMAVNEKDPSSPEGFRKIRRIADKLVDNALDGDTIAINSIRDTLDGRPRQQVDMEHSGNVTINRKTVYESKPDTD